MFPPLNSIHALKTKCISISIERNIGVIYFKPVQIIGWWTDTDAFTNGKFLFWNELLKFKVMAVSLCISTIEIMILNESACATGL